MMRRRAALAAFMVLGMLGVPVGAQEDPGNQCARPAAAPPPEPLEAVALKERQRHRGLATGAGVKVAVIDTGVQRHPELPRLHPGPDFVSPEAPDPFHDCDGHGTVVAGVIAGQRLGIAPDAEIISIRQSSAAHRPGRDAAGSLASLADALRAAADQGARVINISITACVDPGSHVETQQLIDALSHAERSGAVVVAAAGNSGSQSCHETSTVYPAHLPGVIAVSARTDPKHVADYSIPVPADSLELSAAGDVPVGLSSQGPGFARGLAQPQGQTASFRGTSFAAPVVSGAAALILERYPHYSPADVREHLVAAAQPTHGAINPFAAASALPPHVATAEPVTVAAASAEPAWARNRAQSLFAVLTGGCVVLAVVVGVLRRPARADASRRSTRRRRPGARPLNLTPVLPEAGR